MIALQAQRCPNSSFRYTTDLANHKVNTSAFTQKSIYFEANTGTGTLLILVLCNISSLPQMYVLEQKTVFMWTGYVWDIPCLLNRVNIMANAVPT